MGHRLRAAASPVGTEFRFFRSGALLPRGPVSTGRFSCGRASGSGEVWLETLDSSGSCSDGTGAVAEKSASSEAMAYGDGSLELYVEVNSLSSSKARPKLNLGGRKWSSSSSGTPLL